MISPSSSLPPTSPDPQIPDSAATPPPPPPSAADPNQPTPPPQDPSPSAADDAAAAPAGEGVKEVKDDKEEEEEECGFCIYMKGGGCKDEFVAWEVCIEEASKTGEDPVDKCFEVTSLLKKCMDAHADYYGPILRAEQAMADAVEAPEEKPDAAAAPEASSSDAVESDDSKRSTTKASLSAIEFESTEYVLVAVGNFVEPAGGGGGNVILGRVVLQRVKKDFYGFEGDVVVDLS